MMMRRKNLGRVNPSGGGCDKFGALIIQPLLGGVGCVEIFSVAGYE